MELGTVRLASGQWQARVEEREEFGGTVVVFDRGGDGEDVLISKLPADGAPSADALATLARDPDVRWWRDPAGARWMLRLDHGSRPGYLSFESQTLNQWIQSVDVPDDAHLGDFTDAELERHWSTIPKP